MKKYNPIIIPRNQIVDKTIEKAVNGNTAPFNNLIEVLSKPYNYRNGLDEFIKPPSQKFEQCYQTHCGT